MDRGEAVKIGIVSDGKYGDRAFEIIGGSFPVEWIDAPFPQSPVIDDPVIDIPECDLYVSYARHPDIAMAIVSKGVPVILGISFGIGFLRQAQEINPAVVAPVTMCSLEVNPGGSEIINTFARHFGKPEFFIELRDQYFKLVKVIRGSPCGSTAEASGELIGQPISPETLRHFGLRICHFCRAPRFGRTCDKELSGLLHIRELLHAIDMIGYPIKNSLSSFSDEIEKVYSEKEIELRLT